MRHNDRSVFTRLRAARPGRATITGLFLGVPVGAAALLATSYVVFGALPPVPQPAENPITETKRVLGKMLFWEEQISTANVVSCGTCHTPNRAGADNRIARHPSEDGIINTPDDVLGSPGVIHSDADNDYVRDPIFMLQPQITDRAANSPINAAYAPELFWDGRARGTFNDPETGQVAIAVGGALENQAVNPPLSDIEMAHEGIDWQTITQKLRRVRPLDLATVIPADVESALQGNPDYPELFRRAFGDGAITAKRIAFAIATYERTLIADETPWDRFQAGETTALTPPQQQGLAAFQTSNCNVCHVGPLFTDQSFRNIGLRPIQEDRGRQNVTNNIADRGKFKVPSLRNAGLKRTFMHNGQFPNLGAVIGFYARAPGAPLPFPDNRDPVLVTVNVPPGAAPLIQDFIQNGLTDPRVANQQFPFDKPLLFVDRPQNQATLLGGGVPGSGGVVPRIIVQGPPMIGNLEYRTGLDSALGGASAQLGISFAPPVNGRITPIRFVDSVIAQGGGAGDGLATLHWPLTPGVFAPGQVVFAQWFVDDPAAVGGQALSNVARIPMFCGSSGCQPACASADFNNDGDTGTDADIEDFFACIGGNCCAACNSPDFNSDGDTGTDEDIESFFRVLGGGAC